MNRYLAETRGWKLAHALLLALLLLPAVQVRAQDFDFQAMGRDATDYLVTVEVQIEVSFGMQTNEHEQRLLGTIVTEEGLLIFDGGFISDNNPMSSMSSFAFKSTPTRIEVTTSDGETFDAEYVGVDRDTRIGFARIMGAGDAKFKPVKFVSGRKFKVGDWLASYVLLPEFVDPSLAIETGMVSALATMPEEFALTSGFSGMEITSVLFDADLKPVGVLGVLSDPSESEGDVGGLMDSYGQFDFPLLGVITGERLKKLIADPPQKGKVDRAWLGITLQALTPDIAEFLNVDAPGGIIINDVVPESPAAECGLQIGDIIYEINSQPVDVDREEELAVFQRKISDMGAGTSVEFSVYRPVEERVDTLRLLAELDAAPLAAADAPEYEDERLEFKVRDIVFSDYVMYNVQQGSLSGVVVTELKQGGLANIGGMQLGDVIQRVDGMDITAVDDLASAMEALQEQGSDEIIFFIWRFNKTMFVNVKTN